MKPKIRNLALGALSLLIGLLAAYLALPAESTIQRNGEAILVKERGLTVANVINAAGLALSPQDTISPPPSTLMFGRPTILIETSRIVQFEIYPGGEKKEITSSSRNAAELLEQAQIPLNNGDRLLSNGAVISPNDTLAAAPAFLIQIYKAVPVTFLSAGQEQTFTSSAETIGQALWEAGIRWTSADRLEPPASSLLQEPVTVKLVPARPLVIQVQGQTITALSSANTVGEALTNTGIALQGLDYSIPGESEPLPQDGNIRVVRVREEILLEQKAIPFKNDYQADPETELDQRRVITPGEFGLEVSRIRVRYEDGQETTRQAEAQYVAKEPQNQLVGYGTKVVVRTMDTPSGPIEYWRAVTVYATSYSPCRSGGDRCYPGTSLGLPVQRGVVGVTRAWYSWMAGQQVYVPGYGQATVADVGGGIPGTYWIDLGFSDSDFESWHSNVTIYFLTPIPASIPWILP